MTENGRARNVALVGPSGAGKTTLLESMLWVAGSIGRKGRVADGTSIGDASPEARERQISTEINAASFEHGPCRFTVLDCPGSVELQQEAASALVGCDLAVVVVEPVPERMTAVAPLLQRLDAMELPHLVFINRMDRSDCPYRDLLAALRRISARPVIPHQYAIGRGDDLVGYIELIGEEAFAYRDGGPSDRIPLPEEYREREQTARREMLETLADFDDDLMETLLDDKEPQPEHIRRDLRASLGADQVVPVLMGVAERDMGVRRLLQAMLDAAPEPAARAAALGVAEDGPPLLQVLKTWYLPHSGKLSLARVWRGPVRDGMGLSDGNGTAMRIGGIVRLAPGQPTPIAEAAAGEIVGLAKLEQAATGAVLAAGDGAVPELPTPPASRPMLAVAVTAVNRADEVKLSGAFARLVDEDPSLRIEHDAETRQTLLWGQGEIHLRIAADRLRSRHHVAVEMTEPRTPYRETIKGSAEAHGRHKKQSGGHGQFGDVKIAIAPLPRGEGFRFESKIVGGSIPRQFIPAIESGARDSLARGPLGFPVVDVAVTVHDGQFHTVDSNELSFKMATALALKDGLPRCRPVLLEPMLEVTVSVPTEFTAKALQLLTGRRGQILGYEAKAGWSGWDEIRAHVPQGEIGTFIVDLRSSSQGTGFFDWRPAHLHEVPERLAQAIVDKHREAAAA